MTADLRRLNFIDRVAARYCARRGLLPRVFAHTESSLVRDFMFVRHHESQTQLNQDLFALIATRFTPGYFVEIGANDGFVLSNTLLLEQNFGWRGLLVEANPKYAPTLKQRAAKSVIKAVGKQKGTQRFIDAGVYGGLADSIDESHSRHTAKAATIEVECDTVHSILDDANAPLCIDFVSIDVEGAEVMVLQQLLAGHRVIRSGCIEVNSRTEDSALISRMLRERGLSVAWEGATGHDIFFLDERVAPT